MGKLKGLLAIGIVVGAFFVAWRMIPPYFNKYQFQDNLDDIARRNSYINRTDDDVKQMVVQKAQSMDIPLQEDQVSVSRSADGISITAHYNIQVDLVVKQVDLDFVVNSYNKRI